MSAGRGGTFAPARNAEQRLEALKRANDIRILRSRVKADVKSGDIEVWPIFADPAPELANMRVYDLLLAMPKFGTVKAGALMRRLSISQSKTLGGMSDRQRHALVDVIRGPLVEPEGHGRRGEPGRAGAKPLPESRPETPSGSTSDGP